MTSKDKLRREIASLEEEVGRLRMDNFIWRNRCRIRSDARDDAHEHAHLWKEVARTLLRQRNDWRTDARREESRADHLGRAHRECHMQRDGATARADKAEKERDDALAEVERLSGMRHADTMTPRELLDAAWDAAHVPEGGVIPVRRGYIGRTSSGRIYLDADGPALNPLLTSEEGYERRLLDAPVKPEPARPVVTDEMVERARRMYPLSSGIVRDMLTAALTEDGAA